MELTVAEIAEATGGRLVGDGAVVVSSYSQDSRLIEPGALFVPLVAERDGHDFIADAVTAGAVAHLTSRPDPGGVGTVPAVVVDDTQVALERIARAVRDRLAGPVVAITGSVGKTSVKDLTASVLGADRPTHSASRSHNNEIGLPLTLAATPDAHHAVVVEMGARGRGHIAHLCEIARPTIGVVTRVAQAHTAMFGSVAEVARAKAELVEALPSNGFAVLNAEDPAVGEMASRTTAAVLYYGGDRGDVRALEVRLDEELRPTFLLAHRRDTVEVCLRARGVHMISNALAAAAVGVAAGVDLATIAEGLGTAELSPLRMDVRRTPSGAVVINDAYNANPASMAAALDALCAVPARRRFAVVGVMAELTDDEHVGEHRAVAERAAAAGVRVVAVAEPAYGVYTVADVDAAVAALGELGEGDAVLVKGSRVAALERVVERLLVVAGDG